jgi:hypothetical protein
MIKAAEERVSAWWQWCRATGKVVVMESGHVTERARQRALVRRGYDAISLTYRSDDGDAAAASAEDVSRYASWVVELAGLLRPGAGLLTSAAGPGYRQPVSWPATGCRCSGLISLQSSFTGLSAWFPPPASCRPTWLRCN